METSDIPVERVMTSGLVSVTPETPVAEAGTLLLEHDIGSLIVADEGGGLAGIMTSTDFVAVVTSDHSSEGHTVGQYMTSSVVTVDRDDSLKDAAATMIAEDVQHLPVEGEDGSIAGMLSATDLTDYLSYLEE